MSTVARAQQQIPTTLLAAKSVDPFPCVDNLWTIYAKKGSRTVFLTVGAGTSALPDLDLAETLGCSLNYVPIGAEQTAAWEEVAACLKARARAPEAKHLFSAGAEEKWILPKHIHRIDALPWWGNGSVDVSGVSAMPTQKFFPLVESVCRRMNLTETRLDILKLDVPEELERPILLAALEAGFRPGIVLVRWNKMPNSDVPTSLTAGHLQNCGYSLVKTHDNKFAYFFMDRDVYMTCSWEETTVPNPLIKEIVDSVQKSIKSAEGNAHRAQPNVSVPVPVAPRGAATDESIVAPSTTGA